MGAYYAKHKLARGVDKPYRSLQTKWGTIILDVSKYMSYYEELISLNIYSVFEDDVFLRPPDYFKLRNQQFICVQTLLVVAS